MEHLKIKNFGPIERADVKFGDLTFFVGPQASGKSITLEALKLIKDRDNIVETLNRYNYLINHNGRRLLNAYFGEGMDALWHDDTSLELDGKHLTLDHLSDASEGQESSIFYIPAQRIICMGDGYPKFFGDFSFTTPYVLREFTETLRTLLQFGLGDTKVIFPMRDDSEEISVEAFEKSIFHQGEVVMDEVAGQKKMLLSVSDMRIPFMAWSAGQKEFMPLLLGFYCLAVSPSTLMKRRPYNTVIIEEPEMGLHPKAIVSVLLHICGLMASGYKVLVSTHSSIIIEFAWAFNTLKHHCHDFHGALCKLFEVGSESAAGRMLREIEGKGVATYFFSRQESTGKVTTRDISTLDISSDEPFLADWGGLSEFSTRVNDIVSEYYTAQ